MAPFHLWPKMRKKKIGTNRKLRGSTKSQIIPKARVIFWRKGYHSTSMREIAKSVGCKPANLYNYFPSKEQLLFEVLYEETKQLISLIAHLEDDEKTHPVEQLRILIKNQISLLMGSRRPSKLLFDMEFEKLLPAKRKIIIGLRDRYDVILRKIIRRMINAGVIPPVDEKMAGFCIVSMVVRSRLWFSPKGKLTVDEVAEYLFRFALFGLLGKARTGDAANWEKPLSGASGEGT